MKLGTKGRYAVMAMADLASHAEGRPVPLADIADRQGISLSYLEQLFGRLRRGGLVTSARGPGGGYRLSRSPADTRVGDIVLAVDDQPQTLQCTPEHGACCANDQEQCLTHDLWAQLGMQIQHFLNGVTLEDVLSRRVAALGVAPSNLPAEPAAAA